jgi:hypothetical protein
MPEADAVTLPMLVPARPETAATQPGMCFRETHPQVVPNSELALCKPHSSVHASDSLGSALQSDSLLQQAQPLPAADSYIPAAQGRRAAVQLTR